MTVCTVAKQIIPIYRPVVPNTYSVSDVAEQDLSGEGLALAGVVVCFLIFVFTVIMF